MHTAQGLWTACPFVIGFVFQSTGVEGKSRPYCYYLEYLSGLRFWASYTVAARTVESWQAFEDISPASRLPESSSFDDWTGD